MSGKLSSGAGQRTYSGFWKQMSFTPTSSSCSFLASLDSLLVLHYFHCLTPGDVTENGSLRRCGEHLLDPAT